MPAKKSRREETANEKIQQQDVCHRQWIAEEITARTGKPVRHLAADLL